MHYVAITTHHLMHMVPIVFIFFTRNHRVFLTWFPTSRPVNATAAVPQARSDFAHRFLLLGSHVLTEYLLAFELLRVFLLVVLGLRLCNRGIRFLLHVLAWVRLVIVLQYLTTF